MGKIIAVLIAAHVIADFMLQTDILVRRKNSPAFLALHGAIHAAVSYIALQAWGCWQAPVFIVVVHTLIDFVKQCSGNESAGVFVVDQVAHVISLAILAWLVFRFTWITEFAGVGYTQLVMASGFIACVRGAGFLIAKVAARLIEENDFELDGLQNGGKLIGQLERCIIFLFMFNDQPMAIGFLFAAKSILRFEEARQQKLAEYILIGTLLSFSLAIAMTSLTRWALAL